MMLYQMLLHHHDVYLVNLDLGKASEMPVCRMIKDVICCDVYTDRTTGECRLSRFSSLTRRVLFIDPYVRSLILSQALALGLHVFFETGL